MEAKVSHSKAEHAQWKRRYHTAKQLERPHPFDYLSLSSSPDLYIHRLVANPALAEIPTQILAADLYTQRADGTPTAKHLCVAGRGIVHDPRLLMPPNVVISRRRHHHAPERSLVFVWRRVAGRRVRGNMASDIKVVLRLASSAPPRREPTPTCKSSSASSSFTSTTSLRRAHRHLTLAQDSAASGFVRAKTPFLISAISFSQDHQRMGGRIARVSKGHFVCRRVISQKLTIRHANTPFGSVA